MTLRRTRQWLVMYVYEPNRIGHATVTSRPYLLFRPRFDIADFEEQYPERVILNLVETT